jgi:dipeptidyl aminopeptidase/acylaminoacyl peptidase
VVDMLHGPNLRSYAVSWLGSAPDRDALAKRLSPLTYVRSGLPPVLTIHGDADQIVRYSHATRLHEALNQAGVKNQLVTIHGGDHGDFTAEQELTAFEAIHAFLASLGITAVAKQ